MCFALFSLGKLCLFAIGTREREREREKEDAFDRFQSFNLLSKKQTKAKERESENSTKFVSTSKNKLNQIYYQDYENDSFSVFEIKMK